MTDLSQPAAREDLLARARTLMEREPGFGRFLAATVAATDPADFEDLDPDLLEAALRRAYERLGQRGAAPHMVQVTPPPRPGAPEIIDIYSADMPFIVDSVLAAIRALGSSVRFMAHPILHFDPGSWRVLETAAPDSRPESFLHIHIQPLPDAAARAALADELDTVFVQLDHVVGDWRPMLERLHQVVQSWHDTPPQAPPPLLAEAMHFLGWLAEHNFTFLGLREYRLQAGPGPGEAPVLVPVAGSGLGILRDPDLLFLRTGSDYVEMTPQHAAFLAEPEPLLVTKANIRARVHRRSHMDYVGVKLYGADGQVSGELRLLGLFTTASLATPQAEVPIIRRKLAEVLRRADLPPHSHAHKALLETLEDYPREELFQISVDQLYEFATTISTLGDRPRVRVLSRIDRFDNFVSILLFMPRERYDSEVRARVGAHLAEAYDGRVSAWYPSFEGELVRVHFIIGRTGGPTPSPERARLEREVGEITLSFADRLRRAAADPAAIRPWLDAFSTAYQAQATPAAALADIAVISGLSDARPVALRLGHDRPGGGLGLKVYHRQNPIPLSDRVPVLENFGFRVIDEHTYTVDAPDSGLVYIHDTLLLPPDGVGIVGDDQFGRLEDAVFAVSQGDAESDALNQLTLRAGLVWTDVEILRALTRYLRQVGIAFSRSYLMTVLAAHPEVAEALLRLFHARHDPGFSGHRERAATAARDTIAAALEATRSLDEDRIIRRYLNLLEAVLRTNAWQRDSDGKRRPALALKLDTTRIDELPPPHPYREIFVYSPRVEGLHLRFGAIARGGLRWSSRPEDFRTEVLGLVKAQQVKNAIIVPVGAKGAFVPRRLPADDREAIQREGTACYEIFVSTLLDVTDNLEREIIVPPPDVRRLDGDDSYLVVAADKGTASFSDLANAIATRRGYWLGDAFASGGSAGYDHKAMGITARGGWEAVKRHFRELDRDIRTETFTAVGVGDMSGDVFGNAMMLSPGIRLVAAFDHRDIFIDPDPDPETGLAERRRLFSVPRSSWQDYDQALLSKGGGVYPRSLKSVPLFAEARRALGLGSGEVTPDQVIAAILRADVDLLWFGGIGTYVRASDETDLEVGDKANDAIRVTGRELRARIVGEGANLGVTQRGRIEYALAGGRINTDAIDNSAGVNSSDLEVNIKIALGPLLRNGQLTEQVRNEVLVAMTDEVAALCLRNNYLQTLALSIASHRGAAEFPDHLSLIAALEQRGALDRAVEFLPDDAALAERAAAGQVLTRPELAVLLAYAKLTLYEDLLATTVPDDLYLSRELYRYFPDRLVDAFPDAVSNHRLRREIIATVLANAMINRGGPAYVNEMQTATSADAGAVAAAYAAVRDSFEMQDLHAAIDALDGRVSGQTQLDLYAEVEALLTRQTLWFLRNERFAEGLQPVIERYAEALAEIRALLPGLLPPHLAGAAEARAAVFEAGGTPRELARRIAELPALAFGTDIILVAARTGTSTAEAAAAFFGVLDTFSLGRIIEAAGGIVLADRFDRMALDRALANLMRAQRDLTADVLAAGDGDVASRLAAWRAGDADAVTRLAAAVADLTEGEVTVSRLSVAAGLLADLASSA